MAVDQKVDAPDFRTKNIWPTKIFFHQIPLLDASGGRIRKVFDEGIVPNDARELVTTK